MATSRQPLLYPYIMNGWIKISRGLMDHWLWQDAEKLQWWLDLIFMAAWEDRKQMVCSKLVNIKRGQMIGSIPFFAKRWGVCETTARKYLVMLEVDGMITRTVHPLYCVITICNYDKYQVVEDKSVDPSVDPFVEPVVEAVVEAGAYPKSTELVKGVVEGVVDPLKSDATSCESKPFRGVPKNKVDPSVEVDVEPVVKADVDPILRNIILSSLYTNYCTKKENKLDVISNKHTLCQSQNSDVELEGIFEDFRKAYPGTKRGHDVEFKNFKKKNPQTWREIVPQLMPALERLLEWRKSATAAGLFVPQYANLTTWINQSRWTAEFEKVKVPGASVNDPPQPTSTPQENPYAWKGGF